MNNEQQEQIMAINVGTINYNNKLVAKNKIRQGQRK